jgi:YD repeat-containing protein
VLTDAAGSDSVYQATAPGASTFTGLGDAHDGSLLTRVDPTHLSLTDTDGTLTKWVLSSGNWQVDSVVEPGSSDTTSYSYTSGYVSRILGALPDPTINCAGALADTTPGCRSLLLTYATVAGHNRLTAISLSAPVAAGVSAIAAIQNYDYDSSGLLIGAYDPRISPHLETGYSYDSNGRLATLTPPALAAWTMHYDSTGCSTVPPAVSCGRLTSVTRPDAALGQTATTSLVYDLPLSGTGAPTGLNLLATTTADWNQTSDLPQTGTGVAVFGPDRVPSGAPTSGDWPYANLTYLDANGRAVDTADYGAGDWQIASTRYDQNGNTIWSLTAGNRAQALTPTADTDPVVAALAAPADRADLLATSSTYNTDPALFGGDSSVLIDSLGPQHSVQLADGSSISARSHSHTDYDQGAPSGGPFRLPTTMTSTVQDDAGTEHDARITRTGYDPINTGDTSGWMLRQATTTTTQMGTTPSSADLVRTTRYNAAGQVIESRLPAGAAGGDARTTLTSYYTATGAGACLNAAEAGLPCTVAPASQPTTGNPLPVTSTSYDSYDQPVTVTETAGTTIRTTTTGYDAAERMTSSAVSVTPTAAGGTALPTVTTGYDASTGLPTTVSAGSQTLTTGYDSLGRVTSYTDAGGNIAATSYDLSGRPVTVNDGKGITTYIYDSTTEHRGLVTSEDLGVGSAPGTFTATYDPAGNASTVTYPNGLVATTSYDNAGNDTSLDYAMAGTSWLHFTQTPGSDGNTPAQTSPASSQQFGYDNAGRLTSTQDTVPDPVNGTSCTTRSYALDRNSNRTSLISYPDDGSDPTNGHCSTATTATPWSASYDQADRLTNAGYSYDTLGRTTSVPAADAIGIGSHNSAIGVLRSATTATTWWPRRPRAAGRSVSPWIHCRTESSTPPTPRVLPAPTTTPTVATQRPGLAPAAPGPAT